LTSRAFHQTSQNHTPASSNRAFFSWLFRDPPKHLLTESRYGKFPIPETSNALQVAVTGAVSEAVLDQLFREARTHNAWLPKPVPAELLCEIYGLARFGPTSANSSPARFVFLTTPAAKARLKPALSPGNVEKTRAAPATAIVAWDTEFYEKPPKLFPQSDMRSVFAGKQALIDETAFRNGSLEGGYFIRLRGPWGWIADRCPASTRAK
jgi:hypothetical protein